MPALGIDEVGLRRKTEEGVTKEAVLDRRRCDRCPLEVASQHRVPARGDDRLGLLVGKEGRSWRQVGGAAELLDDRPFFHRLRLRSGRARADADRHEHEPTHASTATTVRVSGLKAVVFIISFQ